MMYKRVLAGSAAAAVVALAISQGAADAHHPEITAVCVDGPTTIRITATAWDTTDPTHRINNDVEITVNGVNIGGGAFNAGNGYSFSLNYTVPAGASSAVVRATSVASWGASGEYGSAGDFRETSVALPCADIGGGSTSTVTTTTAAPTTTAPTTTAPSTVPPSTVPVTTAPAVTTAPTTTVVQVLGAVEVPNAVVAQPVVTSPRFTG